jgi:hypothetical protein
MNFTELIPVLQIAIGPAVLISGVGLLILSLTNRLGRVIDRGRNLAGDLRDVPHPAHPKITEQLRILSRRARLLQRAIFFSVLCVLFSSVLIITLFFTAAIQIQNAWWVIGGLFVGALGSLIISVFNFLQEVNQSLIVFHLEIDEQLRDKRN